MHFICRTFIGHSEKNYWSQYWENEPDDMSVVSQRGHLFGLINLKSTESADTSALGHQLISQINQLYYSNCDQTIETCLKTTLESVVNNPNFFSCELSLTIAVVLNDQLYLASYNSGHIILSRGQKIATLLTSIPQEILVTSGPIIDEDRLFMCTDDFLSQFTWEKIKLFLSGSQIQDIEENFLSHLYSLENQSLLASALIILHHDNNDNSFAQPLVSPAPLPHPNLFTPASSYIHHEEKSSGIYRKKSNVIFSICVLLILLVSVYIGFRKNQSWQLENRYVSLKAAYQTKIDSASTVKNININDAQSLAQEASKLVNEMASLNIHSDEVKKFQEHTSSLLSQTGSSDSYHPEKFYDTSLINNNPHFTQIVMSQNNLFLLDPTAGRVDKLDVGNKSKTNISTSDSIKNALYLAEYNGEIFLLKDKQIFLVKNSTLEPKITISDDISDFQTGSFHFWNGSLYLMGKTTQGVANMWKYTPTSSGFGKGNIWLKSNNTLAPDSSSFAINGKIWVITQKGVITPYSLGVADTFKNQSTLSLESVGNLVTSPDTDILAFTENNSIVYVYRKNGESAFSYNFNNLRILSLAFSSASNTIFVLCEDQNIYKIGL